MDSPAELEDDIEEEEREEGPDEVEAGNDRTAENVPVSKNQDYYFYAQKLWFRNVPVVPYGWSVRS